MGVPVWFFANGDTDSAKMELEQKTKWLIWQEHKIII